jgi:hypothetical protein
MKVTLAKPGCCDTSYFTDCDELNSLLGSKIMGIQRESLRTISKVKNHNYDDRNSCNTGYTRILDMNPIFYLLLNK